MIDNTTKQPIRVVSYEEKGGYIRVAHDQLDRVRKVLEDHGVPHWVSHTGLSMNGGPMMVWINLRLQVDPKPVQAILDSVA
jgi:hypothetical protein